MSEGELKKRIREGGFKVEFDDDESWLPFVEKVLDEARADFPSSPTPTGTAVRSELVAIHLWFRKWFGGAEK